MGPLTGVGFIGAMQSYAEVSGFNGTSAGVGEALSPLIGVWGPMFSACELGAVFLLPFAAIRMVGADRQSGALRLELQGGVSPGLRILAKALLALAGWMFAMLPAGIGILLWSLYGGALDGRELASVIGGHVLNAGLTIALGFSAAAVTEHPSTAAIATLGITVGTWILNFLAALQGGVWERVAAYTPAVVVSDFSHGLIQLRTVLVEVLLILAGLGVAAIWQRLGVGVRRRGMESAMLLAGVSAMVFACSFVRATWDVSENRGNSFPAADERALRGLEAPLTIVVHLAAEDPRRADLERNALSKLRRVVPRLEVRYVSSTGIGMFEQTREGYGEIQYSIGGRTSTSRMTTAEGVLESIYTLGGVTVPADVRETVFRGHPLAVPPRGAPAIFYGVWPGAILVLAIVVRRRNRG